MKAELVLEGYCTQWVKNDCTIIPNGHENIPYKNMYVYNICKFIVRALRKWGV